MSAPDTRGIPEDYPLLWKITQRYDFAERLGGCTNAEWAEIDRAMHELWLARAVLASPPADHTRTLDAS